MKFISSILICLLFSKTLSAQTIYFDFTKNIPEEVHLYCGSKIINEIKIGTKSSLTIDENKYKSESISLKKVSPGLYHVTFSNEGEINVLYKQHSAVQKVIRFVKHKINITPLLNFSETKNDTLFIKSISEKKLLHVKMELNLNDAPPHKDLDKYFQQFKLMSADLSVTVNGVMRIFPIKNNTLVVTAELLDLFKNCKTVLLNNIKYHHPELGEIKGTPAIIPIK